MRAAETTAPAAVSDMEKQQLALGSREQALCLLISARSTWRTGPIGRARAMEVDLVKGDDTV